jgi:type I restriction enzyme S subunit
MNEENSSPSKIPVGWIGLPAADACVKIQDGTHFSPKTQLSRAAAPTGFPYITAKNVRSSGLDLSDITFLREEDHRAIFRRCDCTKGDVLLVKDGVNTGDVALNTVDGEVSLLSSVCMLRPRVGLLSAGFLRYYLQSPAGQSSLTGRMSGTAIRRIVLHRIKQTPVLVCSLPEQHRIVEAVESYLTRLDDAVATLERVQRNLKRYRASVLKAAVEGRLVPTEAELARGERRDYEPASVLLERILAERRRRWQEAGGRGKYQEPVKPDKSKLPKLPEGWCWATVECLVGVGTGATPNKGNDRYWQDGNVPWVTSAVAGLGIVTQPSAFVTEAAMRETNLTLYPPGTLLVAMYGEGKTRGRCAELAIDSTTNQALAALVTTGMGMQVRPWLKLFMSFNYDNIRRKASGGVQPNLNLGIVRSITMPFPPYAEQNRIVLEAEAKISIASRAEADLRRQQLQAARLRQSVLKWAFEGKLAEQDPDDEPASVLLERIKAERVDTGATSWNGQIGRKSRRSA